MTLCIALCDDDKIALNNELRLIKDVLNEKKIKHSIDIFSSPQKLLQSDTVYDIIFLDIEMAEMDGISLAEKISITNKSCLFFFVTNYEAYFDNASNVRPFRFWTKPIDRRRLVYGIDSAIQELYKNNQFINVMVNSENIQIFISNIIYIYVQNKKTHIITTKGEIIVSIPYQTVFEQVKDYTNFFEPFRGYCINFSYIKRYGKIMRIDLGMVLAIIFEYIIFIYYADTLFYRKRNKYLCYAIIALVYIADLFICARGKIVVNTLTFVVIHLVIFGVCYRISWKSALFQSILLAAITSACEFLVIFIPYIRIIPDNTIAMTSSQSLILTFASKLLYLIGIMIISRVFCKKQKNVQATSLGLLSIPILTVIIIMLVMKVNTTSHLLSLVCFILIIMNIIIFAINQKLMIMETEKAELEAQQLKEKFDYDEYMMLKENNQQASILNHDFKEHIGALSSLIGADNETAQEYIKSICGKFSQPKFIEYSDNKILNVLLSKKKEECENQNIQFLIDPIRAELSFFNDMDIVTIFSNLINNAMESCAHSSEKKIYLNIHTENQNFIVIKIENTSDIEPIVINGRLKTHKDNAKLHGIGMNSISRALSAYNGSLDWKYNKEQKIFSTTIIIQNLTA